MFRTGLSDLLPHGFNLGVIGITGITQEVPFILQDIVFEIIDNNLIQNLRTFSFIADPKLETGRAINFDLSEELREIVLPELSQFQRSRTAHDKNVIDLWYSETIEKPDLIIFENANNEIKLIHHASQLGIPTVAFFDPVPEITNDQKKKISNAMEVFEIERKYRLLDKEFKPLHYVTFGSIEADGTCSSDIDWRYTANSQ